MTEMIERWKQLNIESCSMNFSCGGDSMSDWDFTFTTKEGKQIEDQELKDFFDDEVFRNVDFYVNSDGHYIGENGVVEITLNEEDDTEEPYFSYCKDARSEWSETVVNTMGIKLTPEQIAFIEKNVRNINGSQDELVVNYKRDFILTDADAAIQEDLETLIEDEVKGYVPDLDGDEDTLEDWFTFSTSIDDDEEESGELVIKDGELQISIRNQYTTYSDSE